MLYIGGIYLICRLTQDEIESLYDIHMRRDFPPAELKPLKRINRMFADGRYDVVAQKIKGDMLAYACLYHGSTPALLDYYAVIEGHRGRGAGSAFLHELLSSRYAQNGVMAELEAPAQAIDAADRELRLRRVRFYERLGFQATGTSATVFGVTYDIYSHGVAALTNTAQALCEVYRYFVPEKDVFAREVHIHNL